MPERGKVRPVVVDASPAPSVSEDNGWDEPDTRFLPFNDNKFKDEGLLGLVKMLVKNGVDVRGKANSSGEISVEFRTPLPAKAKEAEHIGQTGGYYYTPQAGPALNRLPYYYGGGSQYENLVSNAAPTAGHPKVYRRKSSRSKSLGFVRYMAT